MKPLVIAAAAVLLAGLSGTAALAQSAPDPYDSPAYATSNPQSYRDYQNAMSAYDAARDTAARQRDAYNRDSAEYRANRTAYERHLRAYYRARDAYDLEYGPGAYEAYYAPPPPRD